MKTKNIFKVLTVLLLFFLSISVHALPQDYYECSQVCGYTPEGPVLSFQSNSEYQARTLVVESCANMGRSLQGQMQCHILKYNSGVPGEHYWECLHGTVDPQIFSCNTSGKLYVLEKGKATLGIDLRYSTGCSFAQSDKTLHDYCDYYAKGYPGAKTLCVKTYNSESYSPQSHMPACGL